MSIDRRAAPKMRRTAWIGPALRTERGGMGRLSFASALLAAALAPWAGGAGAEELRCEQTVTEEVARLGRPPEVTTALQKVFLRKGAMRIEAADGSSIEIVRLDKERIWTLDPAAKTYEEVSFDDLREKIGKETEKLREDWPEEKLKQYPPSKRRIIEKKLGLVKPDVKVEEGSEARTICDLECREVRIIEDGQPRVDAWMAAREDLAQAAEAIREFSVLLELSGALHKDVLEALRRGWGGLPVDLTISTSDGMVSRSRRTLLTSIERARKPDPALFEIPEGFKRVDEGDRE